MPLGAEIALLSQGNVYIGTTRAIQYITETPGTLGTYTLFTFYCSAGSCCEY